MTNSEITETLETMIVTANSNNAKYNAAGTLLQTSAKVVNGHMVEVRITGWSGESIVFWVDRSSEPLTIEEATERVSA